MGCASEMEIGGNSADAPEAGGEQEKVFICELYARLDA